MRTMPCPRAIAARESAQEGQGQLRSSRFRGWGLRVQGSGFRGVGLWGLGFRGLALWGLGFRGLGV